MKQITRAACAALLLATSAAPLGAQSIARMVGDDIKHAAQDFGAIWISPFRGDVKDYLIAGGVLGAAALVSLQDDEVDRWALANRDRGVLDAIRPFRRGGQFYSINELTPYVAGLYVVSLAIRNENIRDGIFGCVAAYGANTTLRHRLIFKVIGRNRPETIRNPRDPGVTPTPPAEHGDQYVFRVPSNGWGQHSFPGGHVATMAVCSSFLSHRFKMGLVEPALVGLVTVMGVGRLADRGHWLSDQIVGTAFGFAIGREVARRQLKRRDARRAAAAGAAPATDGAQSGFAPYVGAGANGTRFGLQFTY